MGKRLTLEQVAVLGSMPKARLRKHWGELLIAGLVHVDRLPGNKLERWADPEQLAAIFTKLFWLMYEDQDPGKNCAPYLRAGVAQRVWAEVRFKDQPMRYVAELTAMHEKRLEEWFENGGQCTVVLFEQFLMRYRAVDLFDHIDLHTDVVLLNNANKNEEVAS